MGCGVREVSVLGGDALPQSATVLQEHSYSGCRIIVVTQVHLWVRNYLDPVRQRSNRRVGNLFQVKSGDVSNSPRNEGRHRIGDGELGREHVLRLWVGHYLHDWRSLNLDVVHVRPWNPSLQIKFCTASRTGWL